jgi:mannosyl-3-phosphoglycerate synthase
VYELDSGHKNKNTKTESEVIRSIDDEIISKIEAEMAIVIPIKGERLKLLEGVLSGIPHDCLTIIVSNSPREPIDRYKLEKQAFEQFNRFTEKKSVIIHQKDSGLAKALEGVDYPDLFDSEGKIRNGKGEGMFIGMLLSKMMGKKYVGFVDSDNYVPGAVNEYTKIFSSGIALSSTPYTMVRVSWIYKPKISESGVRFSKLGRVSEMTNQFLNLMISYYTGFETEVIRTGNSGEHCMSVQLAELLTYSSGFSIEPYEIVNLLEQFGGITPPEHKDTMEKGVEVMQIETRNPHFHEEKGDLHIKEMFSQGWGSIFHSKLCHPELREKLKAELVSRGILDKVKEPPQLPKMRPFIDIDILKFEKILKEQTNSLSIFE